MTDLPAGAAGLTPLRAPNEPPPSRGEVRAVLAAQYLAGDGIEIGALHSPLAVPAEARVRYVDRLPVEELRRQYPTLAELDLVEVDIVDDGERLSAFAAGSLDFIVASHFLEHCQDPIGTIEHHLEKLAPGGVLFYVVPDKRFTFDVNRPVTALDHMIRDHDEGPQISHRDHVEQAARLTWTGPSSSSRSEEEIAATIREIDATGESIHMHVWTQAEFLALLMHCRARSGDAFDIEIMQRHVIEIVVVLRKTGIPRADCTAPPLTVGMLEVEPGIARPEDTGVVDGSAALRTEVQRLEVELQQVRSELADALDDEAEAIADNRRLDLRLAEMRQSPSWRLSRPLRAAGRARAIASSSPRETDRARLASLPLAALRADLTTGWPKAARWLPDARIPGGAESALEQPTGSIVRYRLRLPPRARIRTRVALYARIWRETGAGAEVTLRLVDAAGRTQESATAHLPVAVDGGVWSVVSLELRSDHGGDVALELEAGSKPAAIPVPRVLWVAPEVLVERSAIGNLPDLAERPQSPGRSPGPPARGNPLISILTPVHDPEPGFLEHLLTQVRAQTFQDWELCVLDDGSKDARIRSMLATAAQSDSRIRVRRRPEATGISAATNDALSMASGTYIALLDHDDVLATHALQAVADAIRADPAVDMLYSDEDHITPAGQRFIPYRKPDWAPDTLRSQMYTCHLGVFRRELALDVGGFRSQFDGSQDYDFALRVSERTQRIKHLDRILYHWRVHPQSASSGADAKPYAYEAARRALQEHLDRLGVQGAVEFGELTSTYRVAYSVDSSAKLDIVLPVAPGDPSDAAATLAGALAGGGHGRWQLVLAGADADAARWSAALREAGVTADRLTSAHSEAGVGPAFAAAVRASEADHVLFLDGAIAGRAHGWLGTLVGLSSQRGVAAVGAKVLSPDGRVEHAGVVIGLGLPVPVYHGADAEEIGHLATLHTTVNRSAVAGVVMASLSELRSLGGVEATLGTTGVADYCLRAQEAGRRVVWTSSAVVSQADPDSWPSNDLLALGAFRDRWQQRLRFDPFYSRAFWQERADFTVVSDT